MNDRTGFWRALVSIIGPIALVLFVVFLVALAVSLDMP